jgi:hypothetical protein
MNRLDRILAGIAREHLGIVTLETRRSDSLDFLDVAVWCVRDALTAAYEAGAASAAGAAPELLATLDYVRATLKLRHLDEASDGEVEEALNMADEAIAGAQAAGVPASLPGRDDPGRPARFDDYEVHGIRGFDDGNGRYCEQVPDDQAEFWSLYGHIPSQGLECIGDFSTRACRGSVCPDHRPALLIRKQPDGWPVNHERGRRRHPGRPVPRLRLRGLRGTGDRAEGPA